MYQCQTWSRRCACYNPTVKIQAPNNTPKTRILVTGGAGYIDSHVVK